MGITSKSLEERLYYHFRDSKKNNPHKYFWLCSLKEKQLKPKMILFKSGCTEQEACLLEIELISFYRNILGKNLVNISPGGNLPPILTGDRNPSKRPEVLAKIVAFHKGRKVPEHLKYKFVGENHSQSKLTERKVHKIRNLYQTGDFTLKQLADKFGVKFQNISKIVNRQRWKHI